MRIQKIVSQTRRDFTAIYECEHCNHTHQGNGYDDDNFHKNVIPRWSCSQCDKKSSDDYKPRTPKYPEGLQL